MSTPSTLDQMLAMLSPEPATLKVASAHAEVPAAAPAAAPAAPAPSPVAAAAAKIADAEEKLMLASAADFGREFAKAAAAQFEADGVFAKTASAGGSADQAAINAAFEAGMKKGAEDTVARFRQGYADQLKVAHDLATVAHLSGQAHGAFLRKHASEVVAKQEQVKNGQLKEADAEVALPAQLPFGVGLRDPQASDSSNLDSALSKLAEEATQPQGHPSRMPAAVAGAGLLAGGAGIHHMMQGPSAEDRLAEVQLDAHKAEEAQRLHDAVVAKTPHGWFSTPQEAYDRLVLSKELSDTPFHAAQAAQSSHMADVHASANAAQEAWAGQHPFDHAWNSMRHITDTPERAEAARLLPFTPDEDQAAMLQHLGNKAPALAELGADLPGS